MFHCETMNPIKRLIHVADLVIHIIASFDVRYMPKRCSFVHIRAIYAQVFAFLPFFNPVKDTIQTTAVSSPDHFQWLTCRGIPFPV